MLQKILTIGQEHWIRGLAPSEYYDGGKVLWTAKGINPFKYPYAGRLMAGYAPSLISSTATVKDNIKWMVPDPVSTTPYIYCYGDAGKFSKIDTSDVVTFISSVSNSHGGGLEFYKDKLIYVKDTCVGLTANPDAVSPTFRDTAIAGGINDYYYHPVKIGADQNCYVGNKHQLGKFSSVATTDWVGNKLTFPTEYRVDALENTGFYLVLGLNTTSGVKSMGVVAYWDMVSGQTNRWYPLSEEDKIEFIFNNGGWDYIFCQGKVYRGNFDTPPTVWLYGADIYAASGYGKLAGNWKGGMVWAGQQELNYYGAETTLLPEVLTQPWYLSGITLITSIFTKLTSLKIFVAGTTNKLYIMATSGTGTLTGVSATTPYIDLGRYWKLHYLKVITEPLASGDSLTLSLKSVSGGSELLDATTFTYSVDGAKTTKNLPISGKIVNQFQLAITFTAGTVMVKEIQLFGEPLEELWS